MTEIPMWWLVVSAAFFVLGALAMCAVIVLLLKLVKVVTDIQPRIKATAEKVEQVSQKVDDVADTVKEMSVTIRGTVDDVSTRAKGIVGKVEAVVGRLNVAPWVGNILTALKVAKAVQEMVQAQQRAAAKGTKALPKSERDPG